MCRLAAKGSVMQPDRKPSARGQNLMVAAAAGQAGLATVVLVFVALFAGLWLDSLVGVRGPFTIGLLILSVPLSLTMMVRMALSATRKIEPPQTSTTTTTTKED